MKKLSRVVLVGGIAAVTALLGTTASSAATANTATSGRASVCAGTWASPGMLASGRHHGVRVSGVCMVPNGTTATVNGNVTLAAGSTLFALTTQTLTINGNVSVGKGAILALGCTPQSGCQTAPSTDTVRGNIVAVNALAMYLNGDTVKGNVLFLGGGWGRTCKDPNADSPTDPLGHSLVVKDNTFHGSVTLAGWSGCWMGFIRNTVQGTVTIANNYANPRNVNIGSDGSKTYQGLDSTEVVANKVSGVLACWGNTPRAQFGDAVPPGGSGMNMVRGFALGECRSLSTVS